MKVKIKYGLNHILESGYFSVRCVSIRDILASYYNAVIGPNIE